MKTYMTLTRADVLAIGGSLISSGSRDLHKAWCEMIDELPDDAVLDVIGPDPEEEDDERWDGQG